MKKAIVVSMLVCLFGCANSDSINSPQDNSFVDCYVKKCSTPFGGDPYAESQSDCLEDVKQFCQGTKRLGGDIYTQDWLKSCETPSGAELCE